MNIGTARNKAPVQPGYYDDQLQTQVRFLERSCRAFDAGEHDEAIRIATILRVLLHDTEKSTSLLTHLGIKASLEYVDTGVYRDLLDEAMNIWMSENRPGEIIVGRPQIDIGLVELGYAGNGLVGWFAPLRLDRYIKGTPPYLANPRISDFEFWWRHPIVEASSGKLFSRWNLVNIMVNQDGGAHVDQVGLDADYQDLMVDHLGVQMGRALEIKGGLKAESFEPPPVLHNVAFASVRQIAFELLVTLHRYSIVREKNGLFALADPFAGLMLPEPPHQAIEPVQSILTGTLA